MHCCETRSPALVGMPETETMGSHPSAAPLTLTSSGATSKDQSTKAPSKTGDTNVVSTAAVFDNNTFSSDKFKIMFALQNSDEISEDWQSIYNNQALVGALILTMTFAAGDGNMRLSVDAFAEYNVWGSWTKHAISAYTLVLTITSACCVLVIHQSVQMLRQFSHIPKSATKDFVLAVGHVRMQISEIGANLVMTTFPIALALQATITSDAWVGFAVCGLWVAICLGLPLVLGGFSVIPIKDRLLQALKDEAGLTDEDIQNLRSSKDL